MEKPFEHEDMDKTQKDLDGIAAEARASGEAAVQQYKKDVNALIEKSRKEVELIDAHPGRYNPGYDRLLVKVEAEHQKIEARVRDLIVKIKKDALEKITDIRVRGIAEESLNKITDEAVNKMLKDIKLD